MSDGLGWNNIDEEHASGSLYDSVQNEALRDLGFVSPPKVFPVVSKGYYLRSCSKINDGGFGSDRDPFGIHLSVKGRVGVLMNANPVVKVGSEALRALYASTEFPL